MMMNDSPSQHCANCEALASENERLREGFGKIEKRISHVTPISGALYDIVFIVQAALQETKP